MVEMGGILWEIAIRECYSILELEVELCRLIICSKCHEAFKDGVSINSTVT
jgi:hypothetical protein